MFGKKKKLQPEPSAGSGLFEPFAQPPPASAAPEPQMPRAQLFGVNIETHHKGQTKCVQFTVAAESLRWAIRAAIDKLHDDEFDYIEVRANRSPYAVLKEY